MTHNCTVPCSHDHEYNANTKFRLPPYTFPIYMYMYVGKSI